MTAMTELQMGLIGLGALAVVGVLAYNKWQESRHRKIAERMTGGRHADVLLGEAARESARDAVPDAAARDNDRVDAARAAAPYRELDLPGGAPQIHARVGGQRVEPVLRVGTLGGEPKESASGTERRVGEPASPAAGVSRPVAEHVRVERAVSDAPAETGSANGAKEAGFPFHLLSPQIDYIASFEAIRPASAQQILESQQDFLARVRKPIHWLGYSEQSQEWQPIICDGQSEYRLFCVALQLVDRSGLLREGDLSVFHLAMQDLAEELMAVVDLPTRDHVLETAAHLDRFSAGVDIQIGLNVVSQGQTFAGTKLRALAEAAGMSFDNEGHFVRRDDEGKVLYRLVNEAETGFAADTIKTLSTHGVTFLLDVPRVAHGDRVFNQMLDLARRFAEALHGVLVDDNRRPLSEGELEPIRRQIGEYQAAMASRNLPAGGHLAHRLFS